MSEKDIERKGYRIWSPDILWLVPWGIVSLCWLSALFGGGQLPLFSLCQSATERLVATLVWTSSIVGALSPLLCVAFLRCILVRLRFRLVWWLLGCIGLGIAILAVSTVLDRFRYIDDQIETRALGDCRNISTAILLFHKDTGQWPYYCSPFDDPDREPCIDYLYGNMGDMPDLYEPAWETWGTVNEDAFFHLVQNGKERPIYRPKLATGASSSTTKYPGWKGPYLPYVTDDPWANKYLVSVGAFDGGKLKGGYVWCISAGPNECLETPTTAKETQGDDIGYRTK